jgi:ferredoxin
MKGILYYFSGTGNTKWAAVKLKNSFKDYCIDIELLSIENENKINLRGYSFIAIGTPIYAEIEPKIMEDFILSMPGTKINTKCILYSTQGGNSCSAIKRLSKILKDKGYNVVVEAMIMMPNNYYFSFGKEPSDKKIADILENAEKKIRDITKNFNENKVCKVKTFMLRQGIGVLAGKAFRKTIPRISKNINSTQECKKCGLCLRNCPKGNITFENGHAIFHSNCNLCLRCIYICPENAVVYKGKKVNQTQKEIIKNLDLK